MSSSYSSSASSGDKEEEFVLPPKPMIFTPRMTQKFVPSATPSSGEEEESSDSDGGDNVPPANPSSAPVIDEESISCSNEPEPAIKTLASNPLPTLSGKAKSPVSASVDGIFSCFQRVWPDEDVIVILQGLLDYREQTGVLASSASDIKKFETFIQNSLQTEVKKDQLFNKIRHLMKRYKSTRANRPSLSFAKPHDSVVYALSHKVWGPKRDRSVTKVRYPYFTDAVLRMGFNMLEVKSVDDATAMRLEHSYKKLKMNQMKSYLHGVDLNKQAMKELTEMLFKSDVV